MHGKQQDRAIEEDDGEHMEGIVIEISTAQGKRHGPVQMRENAKWRCFAPGAHQNRAEEAKAEIEPDGGGKSPGGVGAKAELGGAAMGSQKPQDQGEW